MKEYYADKTCLNILRVSILVLTVIINAVLSYFLAFIPTIMIISCIVFSVAGFFMALIYLPVYFRNMKYRVWEDRVVKESGFYFIKKQSLDIRKIQYTTTISTRFRKLPGINCVILYAYGGMMPIMFVSNEDFAEIAYNLKV